MEIVARGYVDGDAAALAELFNAADVAVGVDATYTESAARSLMDGLVRDQATDTRVLVTDGGRLIGNATVAPPPPGGENTRIFGAVHPDYQGLGLGRDLLAWQLERIAELRQELASDGSWMIAARCDTRDAASIHLYIRAGLTPIRYYAEMRVDLDAERLDALSAFAVPEPLRTVTYRPELLTAFHAAHMEAFADHWGFARRDRDVWASFAVQSAMFRPDLSLIAYDGDDIASYVLAYDTLDPQQLFVRSVGTRRPWRGRGYATALLGQALRTSAAAGKSSARLDVDAENATGAIGVYTRLGFTVHRQEVAYATWR